MPRVTTASAGQFPRRLDVFVSAQKAHLSRASAQRWIEGGLITVNGRRAKPALRIRPGDVIACHVALREAPPVEPEPPHVLHEDAHLLVVNKPPALVMHLTPAAGRAPRSTRSSITSVIARAPPGLPDLTTGGAPGPDFSIASTKLRAAFS